MGGKEASRGFLYQGFASVLEALTDERSWDKIYVEFPTLNDKVDIALEEKGQIIKCIQVKSTINTFTKPDIENWINDLINDKESPEYKLFLIGQCNETANAFIKSIKKYYENALDKEAELSLKGFNMSLIENRRIEFSVLPFEIDILKKIVRDSLHKYILHINRELSFEQIDFIASAMVEDQMVSSTHGKGIDKKSFDKNMKKRIFLTADRYPPRTSIEVISFGCDAEKEDENCLSFIDYFNGRELKDEYSWNNDIYKNLVKFLHERTNNKGAYQLVLNAHSSIAFAAGRTLFSKSGINIFPVQNTTTNGVELWDVKHGKEIDDCNWEIMDKPLLQAGESDSALVLNVTHNIRDEVIRFIRDRNLPIGHLISCIPKKGGATKISIEDGTHAYLLASAIHDAIANRSIKERQATMHIFASAPNAFMFFLGQNSIGFGKCILYEYDFEQRNSCTYSRSMSFID